MTQQTHAPAAEPAGKVSFGQVASYVLWPNFRAMAAPVADIFNVFVFALADLFVSVRLLKRSHPVVQREIGGFRGIARLLLDGTEHITLSWKAVPQIAIYYSALGMIVGTMALVGMQMFSLSMGALEASAQNNPAGVPDDPESFFQETNDNPGPDITVTSGDVDASGNWIERTVQRADSDRGGTAALNMLFHFDPDTADTQALPLAQGFASLAAVYSYAMLVAAGIIVGYIIVSLVIDTARTGQFFAGKNETWVIIRCLLALSMLVPVGVGFNAGQAIVVQIAKWGSGLATSAFETFNERLYATVDFNPPAIVPDITELVGQLVQLETCRQTSNLYYCTAAPASSDDRATTPCKIQRHAVFPPFQDLSNPGQQPPLPGYIQYGEFSSIVGAAGSKFDYCGSIRFNWIASSKNFSSSNIFGFQSHDVSFEMRKKMMMAHYNAMQNLFQVVPTVPVDGNRHNAHEWGLRVATQFMPSSEYRYYCGDTNFLPTNQINVNAAGTAFDLYVDATTPGRLGNVIMAPSMLHNYTPQASDMCNDTEIPEAQFQQWREEPYFTDAEFRGLVGTYMNFLEAEIQELEVMYREQMMATMRDRVGRYGWMAGGAFFMEIVNMNEAFVGGIAAVPEIDNRSTGNWIDTSRAASIGSTIGDLFSTRSARKARSLNRKMYERQVQAQAGVNEVYSGIVKKLQQDVANLQNPNGDGRQSGNPVAIPDSSLDNVQKNSKSIRGLMASLPLRGVLLAANADGNKNNPIQTLMNIGTMCEAVALAIIGIAILSTFEGFTFSMGSGLAMTFLPLGFALLGAALTLLVVIPLIPATRFFFGILTWLIAVFEAVIAIPMMALGHLRTDGNGVMGAAQAGYMIILQMFLRPVLMVFGLIVGLMVFNVVMGLFIQLFMETITSTSVGAPSVIRTFGYVIVFVGLSYSIANLAFKPINDFPDRALQWIGAQGQSHYADTDAMRRVSGTFSGELASAGVRGIQDVAARKQSNRQHKELLSATRGDDNEGQGKKKTDGNVGKDAGAKS